jgi:hypothetical protein
MSRTSRQGLVIGNRERLRLDFTRAAPLRDIYPQLAEVRVEFEFDDGTALTPSPQAYSYFPAARGFFRYSCPCHSCSGEFDLSAQVAELAGGTGNRQRSRHVDVACTGQRAHDLKAGEACPICARVRVSTVLRSSEPSA